VRANWSPIRFPGGRSADALVPRRAAGLFGVQSDRIAGIARRIDGGRDRL
jgi:hypothetical protein